MFLNLINHTASAWTADRILLVVSGVKKKNEIKISRFSRPVTVTWHTSYVHSLVRQQWQRVVECVACSAATRRKEDGLANLLLPPFSGDVCGVRSSTSKWALGACASHERSTLQGAVLCAVQCCSLIYPQHVSIIQTNYMSRHWQDGCGLNS